MRFCRSRRGFLASALVASLSLTVVGCDKEKDETKDKESAQTVLKETSTKMDNVYTYMVPGSLAIPSGTTLEGDPCANTDGFFDCQPNLLKLYLDLGRGMIKQTKTMTDFVATAMAKFTPPASGELATGESDITKVEYNFKSASEFDVIFHTAAGAFLDLSAKDSVFKMSIDMSAEPEEQQPSKASIEVNYITETEFDVTITMADQPCADDDVRAPQNMVMKIARSNALWKGKTMFYMPRWAVAGNPTCNLTVTDNTKMFFYTDFAGNDTNSTASVYLIPKSVTATSQFDDYAASKFCTNFPTLCNGGKAMGDPNPVSTYGNPFCVKESDTTWNAACEDIAATEYSDDSLWVLPSGVEAVAPSVRSSL